MAVYSMTGFATAQPDPTSAEGAPAGTGTGTGTARPAAAAPALSVDLRSVNSRFLDLSLRIPDELRALEPALRELVGARLKRGKVELRVHLGDASAQPWPDPPVALLQRLAMVESGVRSWLPQARGLSVGEVLRLSEGLRSTPADLSAQVMAVAGRTLDELMAAREREGERLAQMMRGHCAALRELAARARPLVPQLVTQQRERFLERWAEALGAAGASAEAAHDRALAEATAFAIRIDVAEELTRLESHLQEIERLVNAGGEIGKRLDFLIQELHREANTLGSKSAALEMTRISVDMKVLIEQLREQVQNIE